MDLGMTYKEVLHKAAAIIGYPEFTTAYVPPLQDNLMMQLFGVKANKNPLFQYNRKQLKPFLQMQAAPYK